MYLKLYTPYDATSIPEKMLPVRCLRTAVVAVDGNLEFRVFPRRAQSLLTHSALPLPLHTNRCSSARGRAVSECSSSYPAVTLRAQSDEPRLARVVLRFPRISQVQLPSLVPGQLSGV